jgi:ABC-type sugar transport system permease subunit
MAMMLGPAAALIGVFIFVPMLLTIWLSFQHWSTQTGFETARFVGLQNFFDIFGPTSVGRDFKAALSNTAIYTGLSVAILLPLSVALGLLVHQRRVPGGVALRTVLFSTYMVPMIAVALVFSKLYSPTEGPLNQILGWIGVGPQPWLSSPQTALYSIVILNIWQQVGYFTVLAVAGLTQIPQSLYEAAEIDGAGLWQRLRHVTLPQMRFLLLVMLLLQIIATMQVFIEPYALTGTSNPDTITVMVLIYRYAFVVNQDFGLAAAMSVQLFIVLGLFSALYLRLTRDKD